jgi:hypothetical protein
VLAGCSNSSTEEIELSCEDAMGHYYDVGCSIVTQTNYLTVEAAVGFCKMSWVKSFSGNSFCEHEFLDVLICTRFITKEQCVICYDAIMSLEACND